MLMNQLLRKSHRMALAAILSLMPYVASAAGTPIVLMNANIASEYVVTSMPMTKSPACPLIGYMQFFPGGTITGMFITDMARSKAKKFTANYAITGGKDISFSNVDQPDVPVQNINGTLTRSLVTDPKRPPIEYLILRTGTGGPCPNETYKLTLTGDEE
jgi:hypothetical protein